MTNKVTVCGHIAKDIIYDVPYHPKKNHSTYIEKRTVCYGGGAANISVGIAHLGGETELVAAVPEGFIDSEYGRYLKHLGVRLKLTMFSGELPTACIFNDKKGNQITYFSWGVSEFLPKVFLKAGTVHLAPVHPDFACSIAPHASFLAFEPGQDLHRYSTLQLTKVLSHTNLLFVNEFELHAIERKVSQSIDDLAQRMDVVVTLGKSGCDVYSAGQHTSIPALSAHLVDPTGAGDAHRAACWAGMLRNMELTEACRLANIAASFVVQHHGAQNGLTNWETLLAQAEKI